MTAWAARVARRTPRTRTNLAELLTAGYQAVKAASPGHRSMLHLGGGRRQRHVPLVVRQRHSRDVPFDVIGASYYGYWHGTFAALQFNLNDVTARYDKDVIVVETAYAFTLADDDDFGNIIGDPSLLVPGYPATPAGQAANLRDVMSIVRAVPDGRGLGVFYWDPTWTGVAATAGPPRSRAPATRGRTRPCSTSTTGRSRRWTSSSRNDDSR